MLRLEIVAQTSFLSLLPAFMDHQSFVEQIQINIVRILSKINFRSSKVTLLYFVVILDSNGMDCQRANFYIGSTTTTTRSWDIYVTQYTCGQEDIAGPPGCLQYHTGSTGLVKAFGYGTSNTQTATSESTTHLQNQNYNVSSCSR